MLTRRSDGHLAEGTAAYRRFMPALMPSRTESAVYFTDRVDLTSAQDFLRNVRLIEPDLDPTPFDLVLWAAVRTLADRPGLNRFVAGGRLYQRNEIALSFAAKTEFSDGAPLRVVKVRFPPDVSFTDLVRSVDVAVAGARSVRRTASDSEVDILLRLPPSLRRAAVRAVRAADGLGLLPSWYVEDDPFYASMFLANLGSIGLGAALHHLYEYGTVSLFCTVGAVHRAVVVRGGSPVVRPVLDLGFTLDERIEDGFYARKSLERFTSLLADPPTAAGEAVAS